MPPNKRREDMGSVSDGYHTFNELYDHRCLLFLNLCLHHPKECSWKPDYEGWFCLYYNSVAGQISYHLPDKLLPVVIEQIKRQDSIKFDGHTSGDVLCRLSALAGVA